CLFYSPSQNKTPAAARSLFFHLCKLRKSARKRLLLLGSSVGVLAAEALHASRRVHQFLLAGEERVAVGTDFYVDVALVRRAGHEGIAARAMHSHFVVRWMNACLHKSPNPCLSR